MIPFNELDEWIGKPKEQIDFAIESSKKHNMFRSAKRLEEIKEILFGNTVLPQFKPLTKERKESDV